MKTKAEPKLTNSLEKKDGNNFEEIESTLKSIEKEKDINSIETSVKQKEVEPQGVMPPIKQNIKVSVIPCDNIITKDEDNDNSLVENDIQMDLDTIDNTPDINREEKTKSMEIDNTINNKENDKNESSNKKEEKIEEINSNENINNTEEQNLPYHDIQQTLNNQEKEINKIEIEQTPIDIKHSSDKKDTSMSIQENVEESDQSKENITKSTFAKELQLDIKTIINNELDKIINEVITEAQNPNKNQEDLEKSIETKKEGIITNNENRQIAEAIGSVINKNFNQTKKEEIQNFFNLNSEEVDQLLSKTCSNNNNNNTNINQISPFLRQLAGLKTKENGVSIFSGNVYPDEIIEELTKNLPRKSLIGLPKKEYFINKYVDNFNNALYNPYDYKYQDVKEDGNGGYRCIALQLLGNEEFHNDIRMDVYNFLNHNKKNFTHLTFPIDGKEVTAEEYIENIKNPGFEMGDLELYVMNLIYNAILFIFQLKNEDELSLIHIKGNIKNFNCILLTICIVDEDHFNVVYEKYRSTEIPKAIKNDLKIDMESIINKTLITDINIAYELNYASDNRIYRYKDMINYMISKKFNREPTYPDFIYDIKAKQTRTNKKKEFKKSLKNYFIDEKTKRLKVKFNFSKVKEMINKEYFIPFQIEKIKLIKHLHQSSAHKGETLSELVKKSDYWWYGIYQDIKNAVNFCPECQKKPKTKIIKPRPFFSKNLYCSRSDDIVP